MKNQYIIQLESQIEQLIEGTFAGLFGKRIRAQDIALRLARAMEDGLQITHGAESRPMAPDYYIICVHPDVQSHLQQSHPDLTNTLAQHIATLAESAGYQLQNKLQVSLSGNAELTPGDVTVQTKHTKRRLQKTIAMQAIKKADNPRPPNARLVINNGRSIPLEGDIIQIGRHFENNVIIDDPQVSRFHVQLRLHAGAFFLIDLQSAKGTYANGIRIDQHRLQTGDSIKIGNTVITYVDDAPPPAIEQTQVYRPPDG